MALHECLRGMYTLMYRLWAGAGTHKCQSHQWMPHRVGRCKGVGATVPQQEQTPCRVSCLYAVQSVCITLGPFLADGDCLATFTCMNMPTPCKN